MVWPGSDWAGSGSSPSSLLPPFLPPPFQMYNVNARKSSWKKGAENFLMRKGITSGGRREPERCVGVFLTYSGKKLWGRETRDSSGVQPTGIPPCLPGPPGAWVRASWIGDSAAQALSASRQPAGATSLAAEVPRLPLPKLIEWKAQEFGVSDTDAFYLGSLASL